MTQRPHPKFLSGGAEMGALMRAHDWARTSLGPTESWPETLKTTLRLLLTSNHPMLIWWGPELIQFYNDAYRKTMGPERHPAALAQSGRECWAEAWPVIGPEIDLVMSGRGATWNEDKLVAITRHGQREDAWWTYGYSPIEDGSGVCGVLAICNDVTREHLHKERLRQSYQMLVESMDEGFCVLEMIHDAAGETVDYRYLEANPAFEAQSGLHNAIGKTIKQLVPTIESHWMKTYGRVAATGEPIRFAEDASSMGKWFDVYAFRIGPAANRQVGVLFKDITDRVRADQAAQQTYRRKDEFLAMLAHELRNPLAPIGAAADLLMHGGADEAQVQRASLVISRQVKHMTGLVDDLLDVSRVTRGLVELEKTSLDAKRIVADAIEQVRPLIEARKQRLAVHTPPESASLLGDQKRLVQVVSNLLNNAAKYTPEGGDIVLTLGVLGGSVVITVEDDGIGMSRDVVERAFDLFAQAERSSDRSQGGLGIGLALVKSLVELHGGTVTAESAGAGEGSKFTVGLPHHEATAVAAGVEHGAAATTARSPLKVMIVDDNTDAAEILGMVLEQWGHEVFMEHSSKNALVLARASVPHVCLLDIGLPDMDGNELARRLRAQPETADAMLVAVTGYGQEQDRSDALAAGFDHHFVKPLDTSALAKLLSTVDRDQPRGA